MEIPSGKGPYCFRIPGQNYPRVSPLYSNQHSKPGYEQLYIFDTSEATNKHMDSNQGCLRIVMERLDLILRRINPFAGSYN